MSTLLTTTDVIDALGGTRGVARLLGCSHRRVWNWAQQKQFPARTYVLLKAEIARTGHDAPNHLWAMDLPQNAARSGAQRVAA